MISTRKRARSVDSGGIPLQLQIRILQEAEDAHHREVLAKLGHIQTQLADTCVLDGPCFKRLKTGDSKAPKLLLSTAANQSQSPSATQCPPTPVSSIFRTIAANLIHSVITEASRKATSKCIHALKIRCSHRPEPFTWRDVLAGLDLDHLLPRARR